LICLFIGSLPYAVSDAQAARGSEIDTVTLVAKSNLPRGAKVVVERRASMDPRDVIFIDLDRASPHDLAAAVQTLAALRRRAGDDPKATVRASPASYTPPPSFENSHFGRQMKAAIARLLIAPETTVAGVGRARSVAITVTFPPGREAAARE
jgi:hypothetical protein